MTNIKKLIKDCSRCGNRFNKKEKGRLKILRKVSKGEDTAWSCPKCSGLIWDIIAGVREI